MNRVEVQGNLGSDLDSLRHTKEGTPVVNLKVCTNKHYVDNDGVKKHHATWHRVVMFGKKAEDLVGELRKGDKVMVIGELRTRTFKDKKTDENKEVVEILAKEILLVTPKQE